jgi:hypothetical protein
VFVTDIHNGELKPLPLFRKVVIIQDPVMVKNANDIVCTRDSSKSAGFLELELVDQGVHDEL